MSFTILTHFAEVCTGSAASATVGGKSYTTGLPVACAGSGQVHEILQIVFGIGAALAVLFIVIAGMRFVTGSSNPQETAKARSTIIYALVGLVVMLTAEGIVTFALSNI